MGYRNSVKKKEYLDKYRDDLKQHAYDSISNGEITDQTKWNMWCNEIKRNNKKHPYSDDFTNDMMLDKMVKGCYFCGELATTIDRIDSTIDHIPINCVGCCRACNYSKGAADSSTFIKKAYYRARGEYVDDDINIWFINKNKPTQCQYKKSANKKEVLFELTKDNIDTLIKSDCEYCHRAPTTCFGVDRVIPRNGYVIGNVVTCCWDCNNDKHDDDVETMMRRNERIADRVDAGGLFIQDCDKMILHNGIHIASKKVCAYGRIYGSRSAASRSLGRCTDYITKCITRGTNSDDIFEISDEFYEEYKDSENITKTMFIGFDHYYTNM